MVEAGMHAAGGLEPERVRRAPAEHHRGSRPQPAVVLDVGRVDHELLAPAGAHEVLRADAGEARVASVVAVPEPDLLGTDADVELVAAGSPALQGHRQLVA